MKKQSRKLNLNRETLMPLTNTDLNDVNGGATPAVTIPLSAASIITVSQVACSWIQRRLGLDK